MTDKQYMLCISEMCNYSDGTLMFQILRCPLCGEMQNRIISRRIV